MPKDKPWRVDIQLKEPSIELTEWYATKEQALGRAQEIVDRGCADVDTSAGRKDVFHVTIYPTTFIRSIEVSKAQS